VRAPSRTTLLGVLLVLHASLSPAAAPAWPTTDAIERARAAHPFPSEERLKAIPMPHLPQLTPKPQPTDIDAIARRHDALRNVIHGQPTSAAPLRIFVTLAMPEGSLRLLIDQAERTGATLVLRGLRGGSMTQTLTAVQTLIADRKVHWQIDPEAFIRFRVQHAPTFVLIRSAGYRTAGDTCGTTCAVEPGFLSIAGDVSLDHALDAIVRRHPDTRAQITPLLQRLRGQP